MKRPATVLVWIVVGHDLLGVLEAALRIAESGPVARVGIVTPLKRERGILPWAPSVGFAREALRPRRSLPSCNRIPKVPSAEEGSGVHLRSAGRDHELESRPGRLSNRRSLQGISAPSPEAVEATARGRCARAWRARFRGARELPPKGTPLLRSPKALAHPFDFVSAWKTDATNPCGAEAMSSWRTSWKRY